MKQTEKSKRVGVIVPSMNFVVEEELPEILSQHPIALHWSRVGFRPGIEPNEHNYIEEYLHNFPIAASLLMDVPVEFLYFACTSASVRMSKFEYGASVVTAWDCMILQLERLRIREVSLLTPYPIDTEKEFVTALDERGIAVLSTQRLHYQRHFRDVSSAELAAGIDRLTPDVPVLLACTAVRSIEIGDNSGGRLVISAVSAMASHIVAQIETPLERTR